MKNVKVNDTRNFALIGHSGDGKTSLGEAILHAAGATHSLGSVTDGNLDASTTCPRRRSGSTTISSSIYGFDWSGKHLTLVDTPGDSNFQADGRIALRGLDGAVLVVSRGGRRQGRHRSACCAAAGDRGIPRLAFVNGMDRDRADFDARDGVAARDRCEPGRRHPARSEPRPSLSGVVDLLAHEGRHRRRRRRTSPPTSPTRRAPPASALVEAVAECDDELLEKYLEEGELSEEEMTRGLVDEHARGQLLPVLCGAATAEIGVGDPAPGHRGAAALAGRPRGLDGRRTQPTGRESSWSRTPRRRSPRSCSRRSSTATRARSRSSGWSPARCSPDTTVLNATSGEQGAPGQAAPAPRRASTWTSPEAGPGDIVAVAKLKSVHTGDALHGREGGRPAAGDPHSPGCHFLRHPGEIKGRRG